MIFSNKGISYQNQARGKAVCSKSNGFFQVPSYLLLALISCKLKSINWVCICFVGIFGGDGVLCFGFFVPFAAVVHVVVVWVVEAFCLVVGFLVAAGGGGFVALFGFFCCVCFCFGFGFLLWTAGSLTVLH